MSGENIVGGKWLTEGVRLTIFPQHLFFPLAYSSKSFARMNKSIIQLFGSNHGVINLQIQSPNSAEAKL